MSLRQNLLGWLTAPVAIVLAFGMSGMTSGQTVMSNMSGEDLALVMQVLGQMNPQSSQLQESDAGNQESEQSASRSNQDRAEILQKYAESLVKQYDADNDQMLSKDEMSHMRRPLTNVDRNGDGLATAEELAVALVASGFLANSSSSAASGTARRNASLPAQQESARTRSASTQATNDRIRSYAESLIKRYDTTGDGMLDKEEMAGMRRVPSNADANGDGLVNVDELSGAVVDGNNQPTASGSAAATATRQSASTARQEESAQSRSSSNPNSTDERMHNYVATLIKQYDTSGDGMLDENEMSRMRRPPTNADGNGDGLITFSELYSVFLDRTIPSASSSPASSVGVRPETLPAESTGLAVLAVHVTDASETGVSELAASMRSADFGQLQSQALKWKSMEGRSVFYAVAESPLDNTVELNSTCQTNAGKESDVTSIFEIQLIPRRVGEQLQVGFTIQQSEARSRGLGLNATALPRPDSNAIYQVSEANGVWIIAVCARPVDSAAPTSRSRTSGSRNSQRRVLDLPPAPDRERSNDRESDPPPQRPRRGGSGG